MPTEKLLRRPRRCKTGLTENPENGTPFLNHKHKVEWKEISRHVFEYFSTSPTITIPGVSYSFTCSHTSQIHSSQVSKTWPTRLKTLFGALCAPFVPKDTTRIRCRLFRVRRGLHRWNFGRYFAGPVRRYLAGPARRHLAGPRRRPLGRMITSHG